MTSFGAMGGHGPAMGRWILAGSLVLASVGASAAALTDAGVGIENEGSYLDSHTDNAFLTRTTFYQGNALFTEAGATFEIQPSIYAAVTAGLGRWGQAVASLSDTITFNAAERKLITVHSNVGGTWNGHGGGGPQVLSRVEVGTSLGNAGFVASTYPAGFASVPGVFTYDVDPNGPNWTPSTLQTGAFSQSREWSVYTNTPYRFSFSVLAVAADGGHAEIHDPLWFDIPKDITLKAASGATYLPAPVPEPGTWAMLLAGLGVTAVGGLRARHADRGRR